MWVASFEVGRVEGERLRAMLDCLVRLNLIHLRENPRTPPLYQAGVRYLRERLGHEAWKDIAGVMRDRHGDCEDLACWRVAELQRAGVKAEPAFTVRKLRGRRLYHILVRYANGTFEDPSRRLGMRAM